MKKTNARADGVYLGGVPVTVAPDGYVRRSPVQEIKEAPDYRRRIRRRVIGTVVFLLIAAAVIVLVVDKLL